jgi:hypothetical protein
LGRAQPEQGDSGLAPAFANILAALNCVTYLQPQLAGLIGATSKLSSFHGFTHSALKIAVRPSARPRL